MNASKKQKRKALIISDEPANARIWGFSLQQSGLDVRLIDVKENVLQAFETELPDLVVLEDFNEAVEELEVCRQVRAVTVVPILYLTTKTGEKFILDAYEAGADDCILYPISPKIFQSKVQAWLRRTRDSPLASLDEIHIGGFNLDPERKLLQMPNGDWMKLTLLETRLLFLLMSHPGRKFLSEELIEKVWGYHDGVDRRLLKNHIYRLRRKIERDPAHPEFLMSIGYSGYKFQEKT